MLVRIFDFYFALSLYFSLLLLTLLALLILSCFYCKTFKILSDIPRFQYSYRTIPGIVDFGRGCFHLI